MVDLADTRLTAPIPCAKSMCVEYKCHRIAETQDGNPLGPSGPCLAQTGTPRAGCLGM